MKKKLGGGGGGGGGIWVIMTWIDYVMSAKEEIRVDSVSVNVLIRAVLEFGAVLNKHHCLGTKFLGLRCIHHCDIYIQTPYPPPPPPLPIIKPGAIKVWSVERLGTVKTKVLKFAVQPG